MFAVDNSPPSIRGVQDITVEIPLGTGGTTVTWEEPTATDNSGIAMLTSQTHKSGDVFPTGTSTVRYIFADTAGNEALTSFDVTVIEGKLQYFIGSLVNFRRHYVEHNLSLI